MKKGLLLIVFGVFLLGACSPATPVKQFSRGAELAFYDFTAPATFEEGLYGEGVARLQISSGVYNVAITAGDNVMYYGQWGERLGDVVLDVEATQISTDVNTTYGLMCRARGTVGQTIVQGASATDAVNLTSDEIIAASPDAEATVDINLSVPEATAESTASETSDATAEATSESTTVPTAAATTEATAEATAETTAEGSTSNAVRDNTTNNGDGYLFLVQGSGRYAILRSQGRKITYLVEWDSSSVINTGEAQNRIRAVCMGSYLALYVNGQFIADASDDLYTEGQVGLVAATAARAGMEVAFDNLTVSAALPE
ncbi:MAG: hypothetical protein LCI00_30390 [Chloroflexi bacterium]|nr:hypothetical protein [Chloroflexota bacterium]MCC6894703.1 hypothetical protein [Anaerolineae bacterium]